MTRSLLWIIVAAFCLFCSGGFMAAAARAEPPASATTPSASALFQKHCAGCHSGGGNIVRRRRNLKMRALKRNQVDSVAAIAALTTHGKGAMPAYGDRLSAEAIDILANYVWQQAQNNWQ